MKNLMIIANRYPHAKDKISGVFVFSQVEELKKKFEKILVVALTPYVPEFIAKRMEAKRTMESGARNYCYDNVEVHFTRNLVLPNETLKRYRGWQGYKSAKGILKKTKFKPDLIHAHFTWPSGYVARRLKEDFGIPFVVTGHGWDIYDLPFRNEYYMKLARKTMSMADYVITVSKTTKDFIINKLQIKNKNITVIPNGYDQKLFHSLDKNIVRNLLGLPINKIIVLSVGNLQPVKGHIYLVEAANKILKERSDLLFLIIGDGVERANLEKKIKKYGIKKNFILIGAKPFNEIPNWMDACDFLVIPSRNEAGPAVLFEALACGKPVIGTNVGILPEILKNKKLGIVVPAKNVKALVIGISQMLDNKWNSNYIQQYVKKFTWENIARQILEIYDKTLE
jgi:glycosyltransferase involved in cell wall biosynthesis